jgi:hypothetical protein
MKGDELADRRGTEHDVLVPNKSLIHHEDFPAAVQTHSLHFSAFTLLSRSFATV